MRRPKQSERGSASEGFVFILFIGLVVLFATYDKWGPALREIVNRSQCMSYCENFASQTSPIECVDKCMSRY